MNVCPLVEAKTKANESFLNGRHRDAISQYADVALRCCDVVLCDAQRQTAVSGSDGGDAARQAGKHDLAVLLLTSLVNLSAAVLQLVSCKTESASPDAWDDESRLADVVIGLLSWVAHVGTAESETPMTPTTPLASVPSWDSLLKGRGWFVFASKYRRGEPCNNTAAPTALDQLEEQPLTLLNRLVNRLCSVTSSVPPHDERSRDAVRSSSMRQAESSAPEDPPFQCVFFANCIALASPLILLKGFYRLAKLHLYMCERNTKRGIALIMAPQEGTTPSTATPQCVPSTTGKLLMECAVRRFEHCVDGLLYAGYPARSCGKTASVEEKGNGTAALLDALKMVSASFYKEMYGCVDDGGAAASQQGVFLHPGVLLASIVPSVKHGVGLVAVADLPAGTTVLVEQRPLVCGIAPQKKKSDVAEEEDAAADFEARFVSAVESMMHMWSSVKQKSSTPITAHRYARVVLSLLALHSRAVVNDGMKHLGDPAQPAVVEEESVDDQVLAELCDVWHHNSMRFCEVDFRIAPATAPKKVRETADLRGASGLYLLGSRLNHTCAPNAVCIFATPRWGEDDRSDNGSGSCGVRGSSTSCIETQRSIVFDYDGGLVVRLLRDVSVGEEICISYCPILSSAEDKQRHFRSFACACALCGGRSSKRGEVVGGCDVGVDQEGTAVAPLDAVRCAMCGSFVNFLRDADGSEDGPSVRGVDGAAGSAVVDELALPAAAGVCGRGGHAATCPVTSSPEAMRAFQGGLGRAVNAVEKKMKEILQASAAATASPRDVMRGLMALEDCCGGALGPNHWMRLQLLQELLAAGVAASLTAEDSLRLVGAARKLLRSAESMCPPHWPLVTGFRMHLAFCLGRHHVGTEPSTGSADGEEGVVSTRAPSYAVDAEIRYLITASFQEHTLQFFGRLGEQLSSMCSCDEACIVPSFMERYRCELEAAGVICSEDIVRMAQLNDGTINSSDSE